jgi:FdhD protein
MPGVAIEMRKLHAMLVTTAAGTPLHVAGCPRLTAASCDLVREIEIVDERGDHRTLQIPAERALTVLVDGRELVTLMTLGASPELLVFGYLWNQRLMASANQIESIAVDWELGTAAVETRSPLHEIDARGARRIASSGCGQGSVFAGLMSKVHEIRLPDVRVARITHGTLLCVLETMRRHQGIHASAGSVHMCALFQGANLLVSVEDVGRHNAVDTITGWMLVHGVSGGDKILFTTARLTGELVMKAAQSGIPIAVSRNGISAMAYDLARKLGMTLFGRAAHRRFICYVGTERFDAESEPQSSPAPAVRG